MDARNLILVELHGDRRLAKFADTPSIYNNTPSKALKPQKHAIKTKYKYLFI
jgi:hypothetical protein